MVTTSWTMSSRQIMSKWPAARTHILTVTISDVSASAWTWPWSVLSTKLWALGLGLVKRVCNLVLGFEIWVLGPGHTHILTVSISDVSASAWTWPWSVLNTKLWALGLGLVKRVCDLVLGFEIWVLGAGLQTLELVNTVGNYVNESFQRHFQLFVADSWCVAANIRIKISALNVLFCPSRTRMIYVSITKV